MTMPRWKRSRYLQFSLASLLLAITAIGLLLAPLVNRARHQTLVVAAIERIGGQVHFLPEAAPRPSRFRALRDWLGEDYFRMVDRIHLRGCPATDDLVVEIAGLKGVRQLDLCDSEITDDSLRGLSRLSTLLALDVGFNQLTDEGVQELVALQELVFLDLDVTQVSDECLKSLRRLPKLHRLQLFSTPITDAGAQMLSQFPALAELDVADTQITNAGVAHLAELPGLTWLRLDQCKGGEGRELRINDRALEHVARMPKLREVYLIQLAVSDAGVMQLKQTCPALTVRR